LHFSDGLIPKFIVAVAVWLLTVVKMRGLGPSSSGLLLFIPFQCFSL